MRLVGPPSGSWRSDRAASGSPFELEQDGRSRIVKYASYTPELNPVEGLWSSLKAVELANLAGPTLAEVIAQAHKGVPRVRRTPHLAYSFPRRTGRSVCCLVATLGRSMSMEPVLRWAVSQVGADARPVAIKGLRAGAGPWRLRIDHGGKVLEAVLRVGDTHSRQLLATEAAALAFAEAHQLAAPRLLAVDLDGPAGRPALLMTVLAGTSTIPAFASVTRLRALGAAAATLHSLATGPRPNLPLRTRPLADVDFDAMRRATGSSPLLEAAAERLEHVPMPQAATVLVHGDLWQGNTLWSGERCVGIVDWDAAGVGHPGIDLGTLRLDAAVVFGLPAAREILEGWRQATGQAADAVAYWDLVAALTTPTDMATWLPVAHDHGRVDLDAAILNTRRDAFLRAALGWPGHRSTRHPGPVK